MVYGVVSCVVVLSPLSFSLVCMYVCIWIAESCVPTPATDKDFAMYLNSNEYCPSSMYEV